MKVTLYINELLFDLKNKNALETSGIADTEQRYRAQAGSEKDDELKRDIQNAASQLSVLMMKFLSHKFHSGSDNGALSGDMLVFDFGISGRRAINRIPAIADIMHSIIVNLGLSYFYKSVALPELERGRKKAAAEDMAALQPMLYDKMPPMTPTREDYGK